ncbi:MAG: hypothetical protein ABIQ88_15020 [Chitinophagaceae bacterium]
MLQKPARLLTLLLTILLRFFSPVNAQDSLPESKHAAIVFPYPMYTEKWRSSIGITLLTTPEDITEEVRIRVPAIEYRVLRRISNHLIAEGRISAQVLQNQLQLGVRYVVPLSDKLFLSAGNDVGYWFGFLKTEGFNSRGSGWLTYPNVSLGYRPGKDMLITVRAQSSVNLGYTAYNGNEKTSEGKVFYNGETFTIALEQPFYHHKHLTLAFSAINNYFYWQTWSLFYRVNRKIFYPQVTVAFIL